VLVGAAGVFVSAVVAAYFLGALNESLSVARLRLESKDYAATAGRVILAESAGAQEGRFGFHPVDEQSRHLVDVPYLYYLRYQGDDFVYFALHDEMTMSDGLMYSASGAYPPAHNDIETVRRLDGDWFLVAFNNGVLELGTVEGGLKP